MPTRGHAGCAGVAVLQRGADKRRLSMATLHPGAVYALFKELRVTAAEEGPLAVDGARELAEQFRRELGRGASPGAVRGGPLPDNAEALVYVLAGAATEEDERALKEAHRKRVPIVAVLAGPGLDRRVPYVLATDVVSVPAAAGVAPLSRREAQMMVDAFVRVLAARLGEKGTSLAARVPVLREALCAELVETFSRRNALLAAAVFVPGADFPVITLGQIRMVLRIAAAHGVEVDRERLPEVLAVIGSGFALRGVARRLLGAVPVAGFAVRAAVAYTGTRALGEAAVRYFRERAEAAGTTA